MIADHSPAVIFHMGMHKTGSTSYQGALNRARDDLMARGIFYPKSVDGAFFQEQHADIAHFVLNMRAEELRKYLLCVKKEACENSYRKIIFSSEDFSSIGYHQELLEIFTGIIDEIFPQAIYILTLRNAVDHLRSNLTEMIEGNTINVNVVDFGVKAKSILMERAGSLANMNNTFGSKLLFLDYDSLIVDDNLCGRLHSYIDIDTVDLIKEYRQNISIEKDILYLITTTLRGIISLSINKPDYSGFVLNELGRFIDLERLQLALVPGAVAEFRSMYSVALKRVASEAVAESMPNLLGILSGLDESALAYYIPVELRNS
jgi:hypothetical protein